MRTQTAAAIASLAAALALAAGSAGAVSLIYSDDPTWKAEIRGSPASAGITGANPRGWEGDTGNGSLELRTAGNLEDWGFYRRDSGASSWGLLSEVDRLGFDWYRELVKDTVDSIPWKAQTPVLRLYVKGTAGDQDVLSELVWEGYYNGVGVPAVTGKWVTEDLSSQFFWRYVPGPGQGATMTDGTNKDPFGPPDVLWLQDLDDWVGFLGSDAEVWGIGVGVGSNWPAKYRGFADNVRLGFVGRTLTVDDNFELRPVPEPGSALLLGSGLAALAARLRRRREA